MQKVELKNQKKQQKQKQKNKRTLNWLRIDGDDDAELLRHAAHYISRDPQVVANLNAFTRPHLIFPLRYDEQKIYISET